MVARIPQIDMLKKFLQLNDVQAYKIAFHLSNEVWDIVTVWDRFARDTVGKQFVRAADSISANIAEGFGRYTKKEKIQFYRYSFGSMKESCDWAEKSKRRGLISASQYESIFQKLQMLPKELNILIKITNNTLTI